MTYVVEFELSDDDIARFRTWSWTFAEASKGYRRFWWLAGLTALAGTALLVALGLPVRPFGGVVCVALFLAYLLGIMDSYQASRSARRRLMTMMRSRWPTRVEIGAEGIAAQSAAGRFLYFWATITHVDHWDGVMLVAAGPSLGFPVNVRHVWPDELAAIIAFCHERMSTARPA